MEEKEPRPEAVEIAGRLSKTMDELVVPHGATMLPEALERTISDALARGLAHALENQMSTRDAIHEANRE